MSQERAKPDSAPVETLKHEMHRALDRIARELDKLDILAAAMAAFSRPVPDYEHGFQHLRKQTANVTELRNRPSL
ncbi:MAG: hypothetical protein JSR61_11790 [Proteobacteria bacterium]|nr:hypothetical protein [Pseudomonadota bacterium]